MAKALHMDALSRTFLLILKKVAFNQAVFSGRKIIPQTSKPGSDTNMAPWQSRANWTEVFNELNNAVKMRHYSPHDGKGQKDRTVPIPEALMDELKAQLERVIDLHERD